MFNDVSYENFTYEPGVSLIAGLDSPLERGTTSLMPRLRCYLRECRLWPTCVNMQWHSQLEHWFLSGYLVGTRPPASTGPFGSII